MERYSRCGCDLECEAGGMTEVPNVRQPVKGRAL